MSKLKQFEVRVYAVTGHRYTVQATDEEAAAYGARDAFQRDWAREGRDSWWSENFDSFSVERLGDDGLSLGDPVDFVEKGMGADEELVPYRPHHNPITACEFIEQIARMQQGDDAEDSIATMNRLISEAQRLTGRER
jgi:hypothetical protein